MDDIQQLSSARRPQKTYKRGRHALRRHQSRSSPVIDSGRSTQLPSDGSKKRARTRSRDGVESFNSAERDSAVQKPSKRSRHSRNTSRQVLTSVAQVQKQSNHSDLSGDKEPGTPARDLEALAAILIPPSLDAREVDMDIVLSPIPLDPTTDYGRISTSAHQKENAISFKSPSLRSPFRHTPTRQPSPSSAKSPAKSKPRAHKLALLRRGSADLLPAAEKRPTSNFMRRSSGSHALQNKTNASMPFSPLHSPALKQSYRPTTVSPEPDTTLSQLSFQLNVPQATSSPARSALNISVVSFAQDFPDAFSTPVNRRPVLLTPLFDHGRRTPTGRRLSPVESPTPRPKQSKAHRHVRLPEDTIFTSSLELSVSPTVKQPLKAALSSLAASPLQDRLRDVSQVPRGKSADIEMAGPESPDVLDLFAQVNLNEEVDAIKPITKGSRNRLRARNSAPIHRLVSKLPPLPPVTDSPDELLLRGTKVR